MMAGGIVTNTNQSASFTRLQARDATLGIDAVYFNPAGLTLLPNNGLFISLNNQTLGQTRTITSDYSYLNNSEYLGNVSAPFFPGIYAAYKMNKFAFSFGFNPIGGGGGGVYEDGVPSFEYDISDLVPVVHSNLLPLDQAIEDMTGTNPGFSNVTGYRNNVNFEGTSVYFGYQANISYAINDLISVAIGGRYVSAKDTYTGYISDIEINTQVAGYQAPGDYFRLVAETPGLDATTVATLQGTAVYLDALTADRDVDVEETASGFTPIISLNIKPSDKLNFALKYEHQTNLEFTTKVNGGKDGGGLYTDGEKYRHDIPSQIVVGATFNPIEKLMLSAGFHYYLDQQADWEGRQDSLDGNSYEIAVGAEYSLSEKLLVSAGYLFTKSGATEAYQSDLSFSLPSSSFGGGFCYNINSMFAVNLAGSYTVYQEGEKNFSHRVANSTVYVPVKETYIKPVWIVAVGLDIKFGAGK
jgi:long-chain fatty acid transport protein